ncbi:hypothetical protein ANANG_G00029720 [Anguilla anguilla]|uniref:Phosphatidylinositol transfer protein N-terminal domain-containing protein n=1 Tax=Anguilla anguilla TaxID=7936 RepID=A0A9D3MTG7_ANGAN|nr:hypothetical protein ANANG_G00029720 [Anguilla anguilla]
MAADSGDNRASLRSSSASLQYRIGQLYMISKHSHEQSDRGEGVEVVQNEPFEDPAHGQGQFTEKRVYLNSKLPSWARAVVPKIFYVTEKAWNYYPYTITVQRSSHNSTLPRPRRSMPLNLTTSHICYLGGGSPFAEASALMATGGGETAGGRSLNRSRARRRALPRALIE